MLRRLQTLSCLLIGLSASTSLSAQAPTDPLVEPYRDAANRIIGAALADSAAWDRLARLTDTFGHRLSGSESLERAIDWIVAEMRKDGLDRPVKEPAMVPHWVRGAESAELVSPRRAPLPMLGLGMSIGTPAQGITAPVLVVSSFEELTRRAAEAKGKIVLFDAPFTSYGATVQYRVRGAIEAARVGAVAALIRSVAPYSIRSPHTGVTRYDTTGAVRKIPIAALTLEDAMMLHRMQDRGEPVVVKLTMGARTLPDAQSHNVMAEITGAEHPEEVVVLGGHIDSWDVGTGAMDDAGGVVAAWEAVRIIKALGLRPRRTIRVVGWTNEENGGRGGDAYRDARGANVEQHVLAIESDGGVFRPRGFGFSGSDSALAIVRRVAALLEPIDADSISTPGGGADIAPLMARGVPGMGLATEGERYFWYHHSPGDLVDKLDPADVARCVATMAVMAYVIADLPERLPAGAGR
ncbi:MAG: M20/M25/M40 family metallo-hydrolase [Gemmatimonadetes bacterium]|nr:M20/M25/M40 family metallo-hydrolase [Gemmatimonadota bacterium]